jgi:hypothetical protein
MLVQIKILRNHIPPIVCDLLVIPLNKQNKIIKCVSIWTVVQLWQQAVRTITSKKSENVDKY